MRFISNGDYIFPFRLAEYWAEHAYTWSYQHGAANPDGIIRLPGRLLNLLVFALFGNVGVGYFYATFCVIIAFLAFWWFARKFLDVHAWGVVLVGSLFFACNPIFLGNLSKVGLILAVSMLPVALTALKRGFENKRFSYFLLAVAALNISLIHPFTFSVNAIVLAIYAIYMIRQHRIWVVDNIPKFGLLLATAVLLNAYLILPLVALGTVDKSALSDTATSAPVDYTGLVDIANTGDLFTAFSLSKGVLKDYEFYGAMSWPFYFLGVFAFYALLFGVYARIEKHARPVDRRRFLLALGLFLLLLVLSTASYLYAGSLIKFLIDVPGGWMFRSPLKWQLYMPILLAMCLVVALKYVQSGSARKILYAAFGVTFVLMNGYLCTQIVQRLLTPRHLTYFSALADADMHGKNLLVVNDTQCLSFARDNPAVATELNQVLISKPVQTKRIASGELSTVNLATYDYILGCRGSVDRQLVGAQYPFVPAGDFADGAYELYQNTRPEAYISSTPLTFRLDDNTTSMGGTYAFADSVLGLPFNIADNGGPDTIGLQALFDKLTPSNIRDGELHTAPSPLNPGKQVLYFSAGQPLYYTFDQQHLTIAGQEKPGLQPVPASLPITIGVNETLQVQYQDARFSYTNQIQNPSFEQGLWQQEVGDCNAYDDQPQLGMALSQNNTDGNAALQLQAQRHIACTSPNEIPVQAGQRYLLSFDYLSSGNTAGYFVGFNNETGSSISERLAEPADQWHTLSREIVVPNGATTMRLVVYGYPGAIPGNTGLALYDNFWLTQIPDIKNRLFLVSDNTTHAMAPPVAFTKINPTKTIITVSAARQPFYLSTKETYNALWQLGFDRAGGVGGLLTSRHALPEHLRLNGLMNGWYLDPSAICAQAQASCTVRPDGSYDIRLVMEFAPQRWFYIGCLISLITAAGVATFVVFDIRRAKQQKGVGR